MENYNINVRNLSKSFGGKKAVHDVSLQVPKGKIYGFLGPNGSGKTTTIRMVCGLLTPDSGEGTCLGLDILSDYEQIRQRVGYMPQKFSYWTDLTIRENMEFAAEIFGVANPKKRAQEAIEGLGLQDRQNQLAGNLSGGWKQRLALAACTLHDPELLLLDEPTAGVDPKARREFWDEIHRLAASGITVLVSTHYMDEAERCHYIIYIAKGRVITQGTLKEVVSNSGLITWVVKGKALAILQEKLKQDPAIATVAPFGNNLHVSGTDETALSKAISPYMQNPAYAWERAETSMEDAFIHYMNKLKIEN